ncbi:MAG TPA: DUF4446 family protein [Patescibacteria group bacterium]|nr:DUF4446 family protein [Patescibacteria group bacterium]
MNTFFAGLPLILGILACILSVWALWQIHSLNRMRRSLFAGKTAADLEEVVVRLSRELQTGRQQQADLVQALAEVRRDLSFASQKLGLVRFNPFADGGGNFSFSLALLDAHNNGVVITSMHGREQNRIYTKRIVKGKSESQLTGEEQEALQLADQREA